MPEEGHIGLSNKKVNEVGSGDFKSALSALTVNQQRTCFVIHVYSNTYDMSHYIQRSNIRGDTDRPNFLQRLGFAYCDHCNIFPEGRCYFRIMQEIGREAYTGGIEQTLRIGSIHDGFKKFASNLQPIYEKMVEVDRMLYDARVALPWDNLKLVPMVTDETEKVYEKGYVFEVYKDIRELTARASQEVCVVDAYPDEEILDLYLGKISPGINIRLLTANPKGNFLTVARKFKAQPGTKFEMRQSADCHDRLFFVDNGCWVMGQSIKDAGKKPTYLIKVESSALFRKVFEDMWSQATVLV